jgi:MEDS: MEthanogen/methylotroph, DcmR Sensory domain/STAS domain
VATATSVEALLPGDHACLTFSDPDERLDLVAAFVRDGLEASNKVLCLTDSIAPERLRAELADRGVPERPLLPDQLTIAASEESWLRNGGARMVRWLARELDDAQRDGFAGLRVTADMCWITRPGAGADELPVFESDVDKLFGDGRLTAICQYDREIFDAVTLAFAAAVHPLAVAAAVYYEDPVLRICRQHTPPGVRIAGELDLGHVEELTLALAEALRLDRDIELNLARLHFMDAAAVGAVFRAVAGLPAGRTMRVRCGGPVLRMLRLVGLPDLPGVVIAETPGDQ